MAKKKIDFNKLIMNVGKAAGGGILAEIGTDYIIQQSPELLQNNPKIGEILPIGAGAAGLYFLPEDWHPAMYGMIGAGSSGFADDIITGMQGFNRVQYMNGNLSDQMSQGIAFIEEMQGVAFEEVQETMNSDNEEM